MLLLYYAPSCPYSLRVRLVLAEKSVPFARRIVSPGDRPDELSDFAGRPVPTLVDGSLAIADSLIIAEYVEDMFPRPALRPPDPRGHAVLRTALLRVESELMGPQERFCAAIPRWEQRLGDHGLLAGMEISLADIWLLAAIEQAESRGWEPPEGMPKLRVWLARLRERASVRSEPLMT